MILSGVLNKKPLIETWEENPKHNNKDLEHKVDKLNDRQKEAFKIDEVNSLKKMMGLPMKIKMIDNLIKPKHVNVPMKTPYHSVLFIYIGAAKRGQTKFYAIHEFNEHDYLQICLGNSQGEDF